MKRDTLAASAALILGLAGFSVAQDQPAVELKPGDAAPAFSMAGSDGTTHTLAEHAGKQAVVLAWFPKAFTGG